MYVLVLFFSNLTLLALLAGKLGASGIMLGLAAFFLGLFAGLIGREPWPYGLGPTRERR